ncbi:phosphonate ABC transporter, permease protein PhnE, partial [Pseudomonas juntendi]|nr:phosphonate ABC transporter, permease protein PhnE [Pseudomonas juntendi]
QEACASTLILGMLVLVLLVDMLSDVLRQRYVRA